MREHKAALTPVQCRNSIDYYIPKRRVTVDLIRVPRVQILAITVGGPLAQTHMMVDTVTTLRLKIEKGNVIAELDTVTQTSSVPSLHAVQITQGERSLTTTDTANKKNHHKNHQASTPQSVQRQTSI